MPILNYTTRIAAQKTASEIQSILASKGAHSIAIDYESGEPIALMFRLKIQDRDVGFRLPCKWQGVLAVMRKDRKCPARLTTEDQARRVAWRIVKDWVESQLAIIESGQAETAEAFFQYAVTDNGQTLFQRVMENPARLLGPGLE
jgi:hypothetical protein